MCLLCIGPGQYGALCVYVSMNENNNFTFSVEKHIIYCILSHREYNEYSRPQMTFSAFYGQNIIHTQYWQGENGWIK